MPRFLLAAFLLLGLSLPASAQTVSAIIPMTMGQPAAGGFRDIPPGPQTFQLTIQSNSGPFMLAGLSSSNSQVTWVPQGSVQMVSTVTWATSSPVTEAQIGTVTGWVYFMGGPPPGYTVGTFYTTNAFWTDTYDPSVDFPGGPYYDAGIGVWPVDATLASTFPADTQTGYDLPTLAMNDNSHNGYLWFTSDSSDVAVYWRASSSDPWLILNQPQLFQAVGSGSPPGQFQLHADQAFTGEATITVHYRSIDSINPTADGDTLDLLFVVQLAELNIPQ